MKFFWKLFDWRKCKRKFDVTHFCGAGNVNHWTRNIRKETAKLAEAGIPCYHIEVFGWAGTASFTKVKKTMAALEEALFWCKRRKLVLFASVVNDNIHLSKYGNTPLDIGQHLTAVMTALKLLGKAARRQKVFIQPVGETQTKAGAEVERLARDVVEKRFLVANTGSRPKSVPGWANFAAYHASSVKAAVPRGLWDVTDHGLTLNEMGGTGAQVYNNTVLEEDARRAAASGNPYIMYGFQVQRMDKGNLKAVARGYYA